MSARIKELSSGYQDLPNLAPLLGGFFEPGGGLNLAVKRDCRRLASGSLVVYTYVDPFIHYANNSPDNAQWLYNLFGGTIIKDHRASSWRWGVRGTKALEIARAIEPFAPSRREQIASWENLYATDDIEEKLKIVRDLKHSDFQYQARLSVDDYQELIANPKFLAGVYRSRGVQSELYHQGEENPWQVRLRIITSNQILLQTIQSSCGGAISIGNLYAFTEDGRERAAHSSSLKSDKSFMLTMYGENRRRFLRVVESVAI